MIGRMQNKSLVLLLFIVPFTVWPVSQFIFFESTLLLKPIPFPESHLGISRFTTSCRLVEKLIKIYVLCGMAVI